MRHDEFLEKINAPIPMGEVGQGWQKALCAVVEATKTELNTATDDFNEGWHLAMCRIIYVIEKELA